MFVLINRDDASIDFEASDLEIRNDEVLRWDPALGCCCQHSCFYFGCGRIYVGPSLSHFRFIDPIGGLAGSLWITGNSFSLRFSVGLPSYGVLVRITLGT